MLRLSWNENEHLVIESVVDDVVGATLIIEEAGDAKKKVVHVSTESDDNTEVVFHA